MMSNGLINFKNLSTARKILVIKIFNSSQFS